jgi:MFS superfamily sulfate permease-like transporter
MTRPAPIPDTFADLIVGVCLLATLIFWWSVYNYLPSHIAYLARRLSYYIHGDENAAIFGMLGVSWWAVVKRELGLVGKLYRGIWESRFGWEDTMDKGRVDL